MTDILDRLSEATEGSRELDVLIGMSLEDVECTPYKEYWGYWAHREKRRQVGSMTVVEERTGVFPPHYTTSLDAALTLVPEGWEWLVSTRAPSPHKGRAYLHNGELHFSGMAAAANPKYRGCECTAATPALALCIVAIQARLQADEGATDEGTAA